MVKANKLLASRAVCAQGDTRVPCVQVLRGYSGAMMTMPAWGSLQT